MNYPNQPPIQPRPSPNVNLAIVSLVLSILGLIGMIPTIVFTPCAIIPMGFGIAAVITGFLARSRAKKDPMHWGGAGMAMGGIVAGAVSTVAPIVLVILVLAIYAGLIGLGQISR